jgi:hypothetical protein
LILRFVPTAAELRGITIKINPDDLLADAEKIKSLALEYFSTSTFPAVVLTPEPDLKERMVLQIYSDIINLL